MSAYLTSANLSQAARIAAVTGLMAIPRILDRSDGNASIILALSTFPLLAIIAGAATAWGEHGGLSGVFPDRRRVMPWTFAAVFVGIVLLPVMLWGDSYRQLSLSEDDALRLANEVPKNTDAAIALILWSAGFETVLFQAGIMSFVARLTGSGIAAIVAGPVFKVFVFVLQCASSGFGPVSPFVAGGAIATSSIACVLYARAGLPAAMAFNAVISSRHLIILITGG